MHALGKTEAASTVMHMDNGNSQITCNDKLDRDSDIASDAPVGEAELDPLPHVIRGIKARAHLALHRKGSAAHSKLDKYNLVQQVLSSEAPTGRYPASPTAAWCMLLEAIPLMSKLPCGCSC